MKKRWWLGVVLVVLVVGGFLIGRALMGGPEEAAAQSEIETAVVERDTLRITVDGSGSLAPVQEVAVPFEASGRVVEILVDRGSVVEAGDLLVRLDEVDARRAVADAELRVKQAEVNLASAQLSLDDLLTWAPDESAVEKAEAGLAAAQVDYRKAAARNSLAGDQLTSAEVNLAQAQRALEDAQEAYDNAYDPGRDWELGDRRLSSRLEAERTTAADALASAQDSLAVAQSAYNLEVAGISDSGVAGAWSQVLNARVALENETEGPDEDEIEAARLQVAQQQVSLDQAELDLTAAKRDLADTQLTASAGGTVTDMDLVLGQMVNTGQTGVVLADLSTLEVEIGLDESDIAQVSEGQPAIVTLDAFDDIELEGVIVHIAPAAEVQSGVVLYDVTVVVARTEIPVRVGMTADVEVVTNSAADVLTIPLKAVRTLNGRSFVLRRLREGEEAPTLPPGGGVQRSGGAQLPQGVSKEDLQAMRSRIQDQLAVEGFTVAPVELGVVTDAYAEVVRGVEEGDVVLISSVTAEAEQDDQRPPFPMLGGGRP